MCDELMSFTFRSTCIRTLICLPLRLSLHFPICRIQAPLSFVCSIVYWFLCPVRLSVSLSNYSFCCYSPSIYALCVYSSIHVYIYTSVYLIWYLRANLSVDSLKLSRISVNLLIYSLTKV